MTAPSTKLTGHHRGSEVHPGAGQFRNPGRSVASHIGDEEHAEGPAHADHRSARWRRVSNSKTATVDRSGDRRPDNHGISIVSRWISAGGGEHFYARLTARSRSRDHQPYAGAAVRILSSTSEVRPHWVAANSNSRRSHRYPQPPGRRDGAAGGCHHSGGLRAEAGATKGGSSPEALGTSVIGADWRQVAGPARSGETKPRAAIASPASWAISRYSVSLPPTMENIPESFCSTRGPYRTDPTSSLPRIDRWPADPHRRRRRRRCRRRLQCSVDGVERKRISSGVGSRTSGMGRAPPRRSGQIHPASCSGIAKT